ncbi:hypothetical protein BY996DRAFT_4579058 [Phakopsora pachyrhizi]|uniref:DUF7872 domain-containing protein n=1 Tax=Phakopsora pachyrhizi TaxID=170000 RepID=A0AAV0AT71_PHAPC|nr:hypothetical protein BY996DRAFT_4586391 [Phakopsora pachyrhizi]KAI8456876.1 hypothetical protein BY996DRAFT_4579058 [Phakopsora pachyrhizi]CAH7671145.1 hypothetical protein PPACK8108_LOCUS5908 [Phakopsora pachyrhizi]
MSSWLFNTPSIVSYSSQRLNVIILLIISLSNFVQLSFFPRQFFSLSDGSPDYGDKRLKPWFSGPLVQIIPWTQLFYHAHPKTKASPKPQYLTDSALLDDCMSRPLSPKLWNELGMNEFLKNYPNGKVLTLPQLANRVNLTNYDCGIQKPCYAEQICRPVRGKEWYILVAAQEWNSFMNTIYRAIGWAMTMIQGVGPSLVQDFYPDCPNVWAITKAILTLLTAVSKVYPTEGLATGPKWLYQLIQGEFGMFTGVANLLDDVLTKHPINQHDKWTRFSYALSKYQEMAQISVADLTIKNIESGISTEEGMYGVLKDGYFLMDHSTPRKKFEFNIAGDKQEDLKIAVQLHLLSSIWKEQKYFITRGSDPCTYSGANGAWPGKKVLSYCGADNVMMNIIQAKGNHALNKVHNAWLVEERYNFTAGFLTQAALNCQKQKVNKFSLDDGKGFSPKSFYDYCSFDLPVCDLTQADIRDYRDSGAGTVLACRTIGGLKI